MDPTASLTRIERALLRISKQRGLRPFVAAVAGVSIGLSVSITVLLMIATGADREEFVIGIAMAVGVPGLVAPAAASMLGRLLTALDDASAELRHLARVDPLTSALNRRAFAADTDALLASRTDETLVVAMVDIDHFKTVNDLHGHAAGDAVLCAVADSLALAMGDAGIVGRFGGDEFVAVGLVHPASVADLRRRLGAACDLDAVVPGVTASLGFLSTSDPVSVAEAMTHADHALYLAKRARPTPHRGAWTVTA